MGRPGSPPPFYRLLSPFAIESILRDLPGGKAQIPVQMDALPTEIEAFERLVSLAALRRTSKVALMPSVGRDA